MNTKNNKNPFTDDDDLDNYINTFKLKSFDDSEEEDNIFNLKEKINKNKEDEQQTQIKNVEIIQRIPSIVTPIDNRGGNLVKEFPKSDNNKVVKEVANNKISVVEVENKNNPSIYKRERMPVQNIQNIPPKHIQIEKKENKISPIPKINSIRSPFVDNNNNFINISEDYQNIYSQKHQIFSNDVIEHEINKIGEDAEEINQYENNHNYNKNENENNLKNHIHSEFVNPIQNISTQIIENEMPIENNTEKIIQHFTQPEEKLNPILQTPLELDQLHKYENLIKAKFDNGKLIFNNSKNPGQLLIYPVTRISDDLNNKLEKEYFPISYSESKINFNLNLELNQNLKNSLNQIKSKIENKEIKSVNRDEYILINLLQNYLENNFKCNLLDNGSINLNKRKELLNQTKKFKNYKEKSSNETMRIFNLQEEINPVNSSIQNIIQKGLEKVLVECYNEKSGFNLIFFSMFARREDIYMYISTIFEENPNFKEDDLYILFMIKSGNVNKLIKERKDYLFKNLYSIVLLLIQNFDYFEDINVNLFFKQLRESESINNTLDKSLILSILTNKFNFKNPDQHSKMITEYLNTFNFSKLLYADCYNYFNFLELNEKENVKLGAVGFCSILIKFKYICLKKEFGDFNKDYAKKIFENLKQLGGYANNEYFRNYMKNYLLDENLEIIGKNYKGIKIEEIRREEIKKVTPVVVVEKNEVKNVSIFDKEDDKSIKANQNKEKIIENKIKNEEKKGGIGSYLISALGFGPNRPKSPPTEKVISKPNLQEEEKEKVPEVYYDSEKKRWVLRGKIYDDEDSKGNQSDTNSFIPPPMKKVINPPPKMNIPNTNSNQPLQQTSSQNQHQTTTEKINKIANPFAVPKKTITTNTSQTVIKPPTKPNLTNRYTSVIDYNN